MTEFQEFPKMLYHPKTGAHVIVRSADEESDQLDAWGAEAPKLTLRAPGGNEGGAPKAKAAGAPKAKAAN